MRSVACDEPGPELDGGLGLVEPVLAERGRFGATIDFICSVFSRLTSPSTVVKSARALIGPSAAIRRRPWRTAACASGEVMRERVDLVALDLEHGLVAQIERRLVERRLDEDGNQEDTLLIAELGVEVGRRRRLAADLQPLLLAAGLERDFDPRLRQTVLGEVAEDSRR